MSTISRSITATWWYTLSGVLMIQLMVVMLGVAAMIGSGAPAASTWLITAGGMVWCASSVPLLLQYRHRHDALGLGPGWRGIVAPLAIAVAYGVAYGLTAGLWVAAVLPIVQSVVLLNWPRGVRVRVVIALSVVLAALWFIDLRTTETLTDEGTPNSWWTLGILSMLMPSMTVLSLWWWDVLVALDRARVAEARLSATQERLRVATDVHDLQGHHLQVIALQLELAERLLAKDDSAAALEQLRLARASVTDARQGTRDLATRFRGVPLPDEIANAVDLLRAAGTSTEATVDPAADGAPASVLGPVIRETTTNVLKHGGGKWARLALSREGQNWRYEIANDAMTNSPAGDGAGLDGIDRRATEAGGSVEVRRGRNEFVVTVAVPGVVATEAAQ